MTDLAAIVIRPARDDDAETLQRLAQLDESRLPEGDLLVAELDGEVVAAMRIADRAYVADPFSPTRKLIELLDVRARRLRGESFDRRTRARARLHQWAGLWSRAASIRPSP